MAQLPNGDILIRSSFDPDANVPGASAGGVSAAPAYAPDALKGAKGLADGSSQMGPLSLQEAQSAADFSIAKDALYDKVLAEADHNQAPQLYREAATAALRESAARLGDPVNNRPFIEPRLFAIEANVKRLETRAAQRNTEDILRANDARAEQIKRQGVDPKTSEADRKNSYTQALKLFRSELDSQLIDSTLHRAREKSYREGYGEAYVEARRDNPGALLQTFNKILMKRPVPTITAADRDWLIRTVHGEAKGESDEGRAAVAHSILTRMKYGDQYADTKKYGGVTVEAIVLHPGQYEPWKTREKELRELPTDSAAYKRAAKIVDAVLSGELPDPTPGFTHFYSVPVMKKRGGPPSWDPGETLEGALIGNHMFKRPDDPDGRRLYGVPASPAEYLSIKRLLELRSQAEIAVSALAADRERAGRVAEREAQRMSDEETDRLVEAITAERPTIEAKHILDNPKLSLDAMMRLNNMRVRRDDPDPPANASGLRAKELRERILLPDGHPSKITNAGEVDDAYINRELSKDDFTSLRRELKESASEQGRGLAAAKANLINRMSEQINESKPRTADLDMAISLQLHRFGLDIQRKVDDYRKSGKNPYDLFDASKPDYFGKPEVVAAYQPMLHDRFRASGGVWLPKPRPAQISPAAPPR